MTKIERYTLSTYRDENLRTWNAVRDTQLDDSNETNVVAKYRGFLSYTRAKLKAYYLNHFRGAFGE